MHITVDIFDEELLHILHSARIVRHLLLSRCVRSWQMIVLSGQEGKLAEMLPARRTVADTALRPNIVQVAVQISTSQVTWDGAMT
jgi:hypothetical protein